MPGTLTAVINSSVVLMDSSESLKILLSANTMIAPTIQLYDVRLIEIPLNWRLRLIRLMALFRAVRLPDELAFASVEIDTSNAPSPASADGKRIGLIKDASRLIPLTGTEYWKLLRSNGRTLHQWIVDHFGLGASDAKRHRIEMRRAA